jgi:hypothetical protein
VPEPPQAKDRIAELQQTVSASRLALWHSCRLKFFFRCIKQIKEPPTPSMHPGATVHAALQARNMSRWRREPFVSEKFKGVFAVQWKSLQADSKIRWGDEEEADRSSSRRALEHYFTETPVKADEKPEAVEVRSARTCHGMGCPRWLESLISFAPADGLLISNSSARRQTGN